MSQMEVGSDTYSRAQGSVDMDDYDVYTRGNRYWMCRPKVMACATLTLGVACVVIGVSVSASRNKTIPTDPVQVDNTLAGALSGEESESSPLSPPPYNLAEICSMDSIGTEDGFSVCEMACQQASCCQPSSGSENCFTGSSNLCMEYESCYVVIMEEYGPASGSTAQSVSNDLVLDKSQFVPHDLATSCNDSDLQECLDKCETGKCCFQPDVECTFEEDDICDSFLPCTVLDSFDDIWNLGNLGSEFGPGLGGDYTNTSLADNGIILVTHVVPEGLSEICNESDLSGCMDLCEQGRCCFQPNVECQFDEGDNCDGYEPCIVLDTFDEVFNRENLGADYGEAAVTPTEEETTSSEESTSNGIILSTHTVPSGLSEVCNGSDLSDCMDLCEHGRCCFQPEVECQFDEDDNCDGYEPCTVLDTFDEVFNRENLGADYGEAAIVPMEEVEMMAAPIEEACSSKKIEEYGFQSCEDMCEAFECCFEDGPDNCKDTNDCDGMGAPCSVIYGETGIKTVGSVLDFGGPSSLSFGGGMGMGMMAAPIKEACSPEKIAEYGRQSCEDMCDAFKCCYEEGPGNCRDTNDCDGMGAPCDVIYGDGAKAPTPF